MEHDLYPRVIESIYRIVAQVEKRFGDRREADLQAISVAREELSKRLDGFPEKYATKDEIHQATVLLQKLEKDALSREVYEHNHRNLADLVAKLDRDRLPESVFQTFVENYRIETERHTRHHSEERLMYVTHDAYDLSHAADVGRIDRIEARQYKIIGGLVFATFVAPIVSGVLVFLFTRGL